MQGLGTPAIRGADVGADRQQGVHEIDSISRGGDVERAIRHVFVMTGAEPSTGWLGGCVTLDAQGFVKTGPDLTQEDLAAAVACVPEILKRDQSLATAHRLTVTEWNEQAVTGTSGRELLEAAGFVRDYQAMTLYAAWR